MKPRYEARDITLKMVTPCVGVWIETVVFTSPVSIYPVTPCVGVWIETMRC